MTISPSMSRLLSKIHNEPVRQTTYPLSSITRRGFLKGLSASLGLPALMRSAAQLQPFVTPIFSEITETAGIQWKHFSGASPDRYLIETMGGGVGFFDFDRDGLLDIFLVNGGETPHGKSSGPVRNALYRNLGGGKFVDVSQEARTASLSSYGMGVAVADYDNDGHPDLFVTGYPSCTLFHNNGDGTFKEVTQDAGVANSGRWSSGAAWFDYDRDGYLDLVVCNYVRFSFDGPQPKCDYDGVRTYCEQRGYEGMPLTLFHNNRNGTFTDVSRESGFDRFIGRALGVVTIDLDDDGWPDLVVTRDGSPNLLLMNKHDGTFEDAALAAEFAYDADGNTKAGMGVDSADFTGTGHPDIAVTNFNYECESLFLNSGQFPLVDASRSSHLCIHTRVNVGWGTHFLDFDNDGLLDMLTVTGHINEVVEKSHGEISYRQSPLLLRNTGRGTLENMAADAGPVFSSRYLARGLAVGDFNNDGAIDAIFTCIGDRPVLLQNNVGSRNPWIGIQLVGTKSNRDAIGAKLTLLNSNRKSIRWVSSGASYLSSHDLRVIFGLGADFHGSSALIEIRWPSGNIQQTPALSVGQYHVIREELAK